MDFRDEAVQILERAIQAVKDQPHPDRAINEFAEHLLTHAIRSITFHFARLRKLDPDEKAFAKNNERWWKAVCKCYAYYAGFPPGVKVNLPTIDSYDDPGEWIDFWEKYR
jgi:hypothetical protein